MARPVQLLQSLQERHGDVFTLHLLHEPPWVVVSDPRLVKQIFTAPADVLHAGATKRILEPVVGPASVIVADGDPHIRRRRVLLPAFHKAQVPTYEKVMRDVAAAEIDRWPAGTTAPAASRMNSIALEVMLRTVFGVEGGERFDALRLALGILMERLSSGSRALIALGEGTRLGEDRFTELRELIARADELILAEVASRREGARREPGEDILSLLLLARYEDGTPLSENELRDHLMTLIIAGYDTTAISLSWALERLVRHPAALERTAAEAAAGGGPYTDAVIMETLRIRPAFLIVSRLVRRPFRLGALTIPEGVAVAPAIPLVHRRPELYPDPEAFRPERFLDRPPGTYSWIPFGGGVRRCLGAGFAMLEMRVVLSTLLARRGLCVSDQPPEREKRRGLLSGPGDGARVTTGNLI